MWKCLYKLNSMRAPVRVRAYYWSFIVSIDCFVCFFSKDAPSFETTIFFKCAAAILVAETEATLDICNSVRFWNV